MWIFRGGVECPKCHFGSYRAVFVFGKAAYKHQYTQHPYIDRKVENFQLQLNKEVRQTNQFRKRVKPKKLLF
ncbi:hypothetical protein S0112_031 [Shewanella phage S0112]|nr:hypothetical protein S0112_031 [Shewanella phage S0112]